MNNYKVGDRAWWFGTKVIITSVRNGSLVHIKSDSGYHIMNTEFLKPIITVRA